MWSAKCWLFKTRKFATIWKLFFTNHICLSTKFLQQTKPHPNVESLVDYLYLLNDVLFDNFSFGKNGNSSLKCFLNNKFKKNFSQISVSDKILLEKHRNS